MPSQYLNIWNEVVSILKANTTLLTYMDMDKQFFEGARNAYAKYPIIVMEPKNEPEDVKALNSIDLVCRITIYGAVRLAKYDLSVKGDATNVGILDHTANIKNALNAYPNLDKNNVRRADWFNFEETNYESGEYPERDVEIIIAVHRQIAKTGR